MGCPSKSELESSITFSVVTHDPDTGVLTDADAIPTYLIYEDITGVAIASGSMATLDPDNTTGLYAEKVDTTSAIGYEDGKTYNVYIEATVDGDLGGVSYTFKVYTLKSLANFTTESRVYDFTSKSRKYHFTVKDHLES